MRDPRTVASASRSIRTRPIEGAPLRASRVAVLAAVTVAAAASLLALARPIGAQGAPPRRVRSRPRAAPPNDAGAPDAAASPPASWSRNARTAPERVCVAPLASGSRALRVEHSCGCNDGLLCEVMAVRNGTIDLEVRTDPTRVPQCLDCFPMVPGFCVLPRLAPGQRYVVRINGAVALRFAADASGGPPEGACWTPPPAPPPSSH